jgi:tetratricopeptide (TPR) repeat protein
MKNMMNTSVNLLLIILIFLLFSCATTQQKEGESENAQFYVNRGDAYYGKRQFDQAISDYTKALEIAPRLAVAYYKRGNVYYYTKGQYDQAISDYTTAIEIDPRLAVSYFRRGYVYYLKKGYDKSWEDVKIAQALGYQIPAEFLEDLRKASGRQK